MHAVRAMVLAAGRGRRMGALTDTQPKPLLAVGRQTLLERQLRRLARAGVEEAVVNLSYGGDRIRSRVGDGAGCGLRVSYSSEGEPPLETAGGIVAALPLLGRGPFLLVNADIFTDFDFARLLAADPGTLVLVPNPSHNAAGDFGLTTGNRLTLAPPKLTYAGLSLLDTASFERLEPGPRPLKPVLDAAIARGALRGLCHDGLWLDVGTPERLEQARRIAARGQSE